MPNVSVIRPFFSAAAMSGLLILSSGAQAASYLAAYVDASQAGAMAKATTVVSGCQAVGDDLMAGGKHIVLALYGDRTFVLGEDSNQDGTVDVPIASGVYDHLGDAALPWHINFNLDGDYGNTTADSGLGRTLNHIAAQACRGDSKQSVSQFMPGTWRLKTGDILLSPGKYSGLNLVLEGRAYAARTGFKAAPARLVKVRYSLILKGELHDVCLSGSPLCSVL